MEANYYSDLLRPLFAGRPVIVTCGPVTGLVPMAVAARDLGASRVFVLGSEGRGAGALPAPDVAEWMALEVSGSTMLEGFRAGQRILADLPTMAKEAIDRFDPDGDALVLATFMNEIPEVAGRPCLGYRRPEWVALEDKVLVDALWDRAAVDRAPSVVVKAECGALEEASATLDQGSGTVWAADARDGYHGGAEGLRWVRSKNHVAEAARFLASMADRVRVMAFLEGVPCSIHGIVFDDYVAVFRPVELVTLRPHAGSALFYAGVASFWDPSPADRELMREAARRVGALLRTEVDLRGPFTIDGVLTVEGFRPTELNPRAGAGFRVLSAGPGGLPIEILNAAICAPAALDFRPAELEKAIVEGADQRRGGGTWRVVPKRCPRWSDVPSPSTKKTTTGLKTASRPMVGVISGPSPVGGFVRLTFNPLRTPVGKSVAERATAFWQFADNVLDTHIGPLVAPHQVR